MTLSNILIIDSTAKSLQLAIATNQGFFTVSNQQDNAERILDCLIELLQNANLSLQQIDCLAVVNGPGNFVGTRIGVSTALGLATVHNYPLICLNSLEVLAQQLVNNPHQESQLHVAMDARINEFYYANFSWQQQWQGTNQLIAYQELIELAPQPLILMGEQSQLQPLLDQGLTAQLIVDKLDITAAYQVALNKITLQQFTPLQQLDVNYIRHQVATPKQQA